MKTRKMNSNHLCHTVIKYAYPNAAEPGYFLNKLLDVLTVIVSGFGFIVTLMFMATM